MKKIIFLFKYHPNKMLLSLISIILLLYISSTAFLTYTFTLLSGIETTLRIIIIIILMVLAFIFILITLNILLNNKIKGYIILSLVLITLGLSQFFVAYYINTAYLAIKNITEEEIIYKTSLIVLEGSSINSINDLSNKKIGIIDDENSIDGYIISNEIIAKNNLDDKNEINEYENYILMLQDLYNNIIDAAFFPSHYSIMFREIEQFENIKDETKIIITKTKSILVSEKEKPKEKPISEPFTILVMGVDSTSDDINAQTAFNGDSLLLVTFNPNTLNATILSIPRDTFVPIMCFRNNVKNKITHAAWYGENCMIKTIENFTGIDIDYYLKINFKGVVSLVDALEGIEVDVPFSFCEQNSKREWGSNTICLEKGNQILNGEEALALTRHRKTIDDIQRGLNQQLVLKGIINQAKNINNINTLYSLLGTLEKTMTTNISTNQILSFYNVGKDILSNGNKFDNDELLTFEKLFLQGYGQLIYDEAMKLVLWNYIYYQGSLNDIVKAMKINLKLLPKEPIKTFTFSILELYNPKIIGKGPYSQEKYIQVTPNFKNHNKDYAINWGAKNNIIINFEVIESNDEGYSNNQIIDQSVPPYSMIERINKKEGITLKIIDKPPIVSTKTNCSLEKNINENICFFPDFIGKSIDKVNIWVNSIITNFITTKNKVIITDPQMNNIISNQSIEPGTKVGEADSEFIITYYYFEEEEDDDIEQEKED